MIAYHVGPRRGNPADRANEVNRFAGFQFAGRGSARSIVEDDLVECLQALRVEGT